MGKIQVGLNFFWPVYYACILRLFINLLILPLFFFFGGGRGGGGGRVHRTFNTKKNKFFSAVQ